MRKINTLLLCTLFAATAAIAQEPKKPLSPPAKAEATLGGRHLAIAYSAPSKRNRTIMGDLVPYGKVWRTGANAATTLKTDGDLMIGTLHVPAGTYSLFTLPTEKEWTLIVSKQTGLWGSNDYDQTKDLGRVKMSVRKLPATVETFNFGIKPSGAKNGTLTLSWENVEASVPVAVH